MGLAKLANPIYIYSFLITTYFLVSDCFLSRKTKISLDSVTNTTEADFG